MSVGACVCVACACACVWLLEPEVSSFTVVYFIGGGRACQLSPELSDRVLELQGRTARPAWLLMGTWVDSPTELAPQS